MKTEKMQEQYMQPSGKKFAWVPLHWLPFVNAIWDATNEAGGTSLPGSNCLPSVNATNHATSTEWFVLVFHLSYMQPILLSDTSTNATSKVSQSSSTESYFLANSDSVPSHANKPKSCWMKIHNSLRNGKLTINATSVVSHLLKKTIWWVACWRLAEEISSTHALSSCHSQRRGLSFTNSWKGRRKWGLDWGVAT